MAVRVGFVGAGFIARFHHMLLAGTSAENEIVAVVDADPERAASFAEATGAQVVPTVEALCDLVDAVFVCTWTSAHHDAVAVAVAAGKAVFCEKPLATDLAHAEALCEVVQASGVTNQVGLVLRRSPSFVFARQLLADPLAGRVMSVVLRDDQFIPTQGLYESDWRADTARAGAGAVIEHSIHDVDLLEWLLGPVTQVSALTREFHGIPGIEDAAAASFAFESGAVGSMVSVWHDVLERPSLRHVEIFCERLHLAVEGDWFGPVRWTFTGEGEAVLDGTELIDAIEPAQPDGGNPDGEFVTAVAEGRPASPDVGEALRAHRVVDALYRSAAEGGTPAVP